MFKFERRVECTAKAFTAAQEFSEDFDAEVWVLYNPKTGRTTYTASSYIEDNLQRRGWDCVGRYVSGKLAEVRK